MKFGICPTLVILLTVSKYSCPLPISFLVFTLKGYTRVSIIFFKKIGHFHFSPKNRTFSKKTGHDKKLIKYTKSIIYYVLNIEK
jgi:hypothetical protein